MGKTPLIFPLGDGSKWDNNEIRYSLRSIQRFWMPDSPVVVIGKKGNLPPWLTNVERIHTEKGTCPEALAAAAERFKDFVWFNDDIMTLKPTQFTDLHLMRHHGDLAPVPFHKRDMRGDWRKRLWRTVDRLKGLNRTAINTATHTPFLFRSDRLKAIGRDFNWKEHLWEVAYMNIFKQPGGMVPCEADTIHFHQAKKLPPEWSRVRFLNFNDAGLTGAMKKFLAGMFPEPCKYEAESLTRKKKK